MASDEIRDALRAFYNHHPYPPPVENLDGYAQGWQNEFTQRADFHLMWPQKKYREDFSVLVAGCGTSQAVKHALRQPKSQVVGIDISEISLQQSEKLKKKYQLANLELIKLPIEGVDQLGCQFDKIICTGVLHHLPEPVIGLTALRKVLKPDGAMHLMVYATYGRFGISLLQEYCRRLKLSYSDGELSDLANTLIALPQDHPLAHLLAKSPDFQRKEGLADALLYPFERSYTVERLFDFLEQAGLGFGRWLRQAQYLPQCGDIANTPHCSRLENLPEQDQYILVEMLRGTIARHSLVVYRSDYPGEYQPVHFMGEEWLNYVPLRLPGTKEIERGIPSGAACVLVNPEHIFNDIFVVINTQEKFIIDSIDSRGSIRELIKNVSPGNKNDIWSPEKTALFFQKLWRYDQVVFDCSKGKM